MLYLSPSPERAGALMALATLWTAATTLIVLRSGRVPLANSKRDDVSWPHVTCAFPLSGNDAHDALRAGDAGAVSCALPSYPRPIDVVFLAMADDPRAQRRAHEYTNSFRDAGVEARVIISQPRGLNRKATQLAQLYALPAGDLVLSLDNDCLPTSVDLQGMVRMMRAEAKMGAVWQAVVPQQNSRTLGDRIAAAVLAGSGHAMPLLAQIDEASAVGKALLYSSDAVAACGGFAACENVLAEDIELSLHLARAGYRVRAYPHRVAREGRSNQSLSSVGTRLTRWVMAVRLQRPFLMLTYPLYMFAMSGQLALCALAWTSGLSPLWAFLVAGWSMASRLQLAALARSRCGHSIGVGQTLVDVVLAEVTFAVIFVLALVKRSVFWHGQRLKP